MQSKVEDVIEVKPEILELINAFDFCPKSSKGGARALCMLKAGAKKRKTPRTTGIFAPSTGRAPIGSATKRMKPNPAPK